jgi:hypothetical protein
MTNANQLDQQMNVMAAFFFAFAGSWLIAATIYSCLTLFYLRLRSRNELHLIYDENFGRCYVPPMCLRELLCCCRKNNDNSSRNQQDRGLYIPWGKCIQRYLHRLQLDEMREESSEMQGNRRTWGRFFRIGVTTHERAEMNTSSCEAAYMTVTERRNAMFKLLRMPSENNESNSTNSGPDSTLGDLEHHSSDQVTRRTEIELENSYEGQVCGICLEIIQSTFVHEKDKSTHSPIDNRNHCNRDVFQSKTCAHSFHLECILDWLERPLKTDCPTCRISIIAESDVFHQVRRDRKAKQLFSHRWFKRDNQGSRNDNVQSPGRIRSSPNSHGEIPCLSSHDELGTPPVATTIPDSYDEAYDPDLELFSQSSSEKRA